MLDKGPGESKDCETGPENKNKIFIKNILNLKIFNYEKAHVL